MTRRKRSPPPAAPSTVAARFNIPASLQQLSALSASLARAVDTPVEQTNSEIVRAAQARSKAVGETAKGSMGQNGTTQGQTKMMGVLQPMANGAENKAVARDQEPTGQSTGRKKKKKEKPLRWKTKEHVFPEEQTWIKPQGRNRSAQGHVTFMGRRFLVGRTDGRGGGEERGDGSDVVLMGLQQRPGMVGGADVQGAAPPQQQQQGPASGSTTPVRMNQRVKEAKTIPSRTSLTSSTPHATPAAGNGSVQASHQPPLGATAIATPTPTERDEAELEANQSGARKRPRVEAPHGYQPSFPSGQTWVRPLGTVTAMANGFTQTQPPRASAELTGANNRSQVAFAHRQQPDFPTGQTWVRPQEKLKPPPGKAVMQLSSDIEARRAAIIAQLRQTHSPVAIVGVDDVEGASGPVGLAPGGVGGSGSQRNGAQPVVTPPIFRPPPPPPPQRISNSVPFTPPGGSPSAGAGGGSQSGGGSGNVPEDQRAQIAALIAQKRAENAANGQVQRLLGLRTEHQKKMVERGQVVDHREVEKERVQAMGQMDKMNVSWGQYHQQGGVGVVPAVRRWVSPKDRGWGYVPGPALSGSTARPAARPAATGGPVQGATPLQGLAEAARAVMDGQGSQMRHGMAAAAQEADSDEDAPGEEDTPGGGGGGDGVVAPPAGPVVGADETVVQSVEEGPPLVNQNAGANAVPPFINRLIDPGDLRSLFSSPGPSSRAQSALEVEKRTKGGVGDNGSGDAERGTGAGRDEVNDDDDDDEGNDEHEHGHEADERVDMQERPSPSAQLLMALANATPPPPRQQQQVGARNGVSGAADRRHRRTRSGLVIAGS